MSGITYKSSNQLQNQSVTEVIIMPDIDVAKTGFNSVDKVAYRKSRHAFCKAALFAAEA